MINEKYSQIALKNYSVLYNNAKQKEKYKYAFPLRESGIKYKDALKLGFKITKYMWKKCLDNTERAVGGRKKTKKWLVDSINKHLKNLSSIASNRYLKKSNSNAYYSSVSFLEAYNRFPLRNIISFSTFYANISPIYKKPYRFTDLCEYCESNKVIFSFQFILLINI